MFHRSVVYFPNRHGGNESVQDTTSHLLAKESSGIGQPHGIWYWASQSVFRNRAKASSDTSHCDCWAVEDVRKDGEEPETHETFESSYLVGADGAKDFGCLIGDLCLETEGVDRKEMLDSPKLHQAPTRLRRQVVQLLLADQNLMVRCMSELTGHDINVRKAAAPSVFRPNIRMADKFGSGRVFIVGGETTAPFLFIH
ncbi:hypothetical protein L210DRAFT_932717 [Boletus edulis BED1]|uniref:Uncharacterized protein n=1 Tax=Boletus edulis BED1 TaxID=1328754 RepID=A0AAD4GFS4_BOLED|nr:hypothetical protein L210DRAFT_932717 [Boletus edulis BED1]